MRIGRTHYTSCSGTRRLLVVAARRRDVECPRCRPAPKANATTLQVTAETLRSRDGYDVRVTVRLPIKLHDSPIDRAAFAKAVGDGRTVDGSAERIVKLVEEPIRKALAATADGDAEALLASAARFADAAASAARGPLFAAGLMLDGDATATVDAPPYANARPNRPPPPPPGRRRPGRRPAAAVRGHPPRKPRRPAGPAADGAAAGGPPRRPAQLFEAAGKKAESKLFIAAGTRIYEVVGGSAVETADVARLGPIRRLRVDTSDGKTTVARRQPRRRLRR